MPDEHVGRGASHRGQRAHLACELHAAAHGVGDHVEDLRERAADLALDVDGEHDELEVLRARGARPSTAAPRRRAGRGGSPSRRAGTPSPSARGRPARSSTSPAGTTGRRAATRPPRRACRPADPRTCGGARWPCGAPTPAACGGADQGDHERVEDADAERQAEQEQHERRAGLDGRRTRPARIGQVGALEHARDLLEVGRSAERALTAQHEQVAEREPALPLARPPGCARPPCSARGGVRAPSRAAGATAAAPPPSTTRPMTRASARPVELRLLIDEMVPPAATILAAGAVRSIGCVAGV